MFHNPFSKKNLREFQLKTLAASTFKKIELRCTGTDNPKVIEKIIIEELKRAFEQAGTENKKALFKQLTLLFHPDCINVESKLANALCRHKLFHFPQKVIDSCNTPMPPVHDFLTQPVNAVIAIYHFLKNQLSKPIEDSKRYFPPLPFFILLLNTLTLLPAIPIFAATGIPLFLLRFPQIFLTTVMNFFLNNKIHVHFLRATVVNTFKALKQLYPNETDEAVQIRLESKEGIEMRRNHEVALRGLTRLSVLANAFVEALQEPLSKNRLSAAISILISKPLIFLAALFYLPLEAACEASRLLLASIAMGSMFLLAAVSAAELLILNSPLYLMDATVYLYNSRQACFGSSPAPEENMQEYVQTSRSFSNAAENFHHYSPLYDKRRFSNAARDELFMPEEEEEERPSSSLSQVF